MWVMIWYMPTWDTVGFESVSACGQKKYGQSRRVPANDRTPRWGSGPQQTSVRVLLRPKSRSAKWGFEDNTGWDGQEKKLCVSIVVCLRLPPSVCLSVCLIPRKFWLQERIKRVIFLSPSVMILSFIILPLSRL